MQPAVRGVKAWCRFGEATRSQRLGYPGNAIAKNGERKLEQADGHGFRGVRRVSTDPTKQAKTRGLVIKEAKKLYDALNDPGILKKGGDQRYAAIVQRMKEYELLVEPFMELFTAGCYGGGDWLSISLA